MVTDIRRERLNTQHGSCSSVTRDGEIDTPVGDLPKDWVDGTHKEEGGVNHYGVCPQQGVEVSKDAMCGFICKSSMWKAWDDPTNVKLNVEDLKAARAPEME